MKRPSTRLLVISTVVIFVLAGWGLLAFKNTARINRNTQGSLFYGFYDVGLYLSGTEVTTPLNDWSFTDTLRWVQIETKPWYLIPYHVTVDFARDINDNSLYLHSSYQGPLPGQPDLRDSFTAARAWNKHLIRNPNMRFKLMGDDRIFRAVARRVTDPAEYLRARLAFHTKVLGQGTGTCPEDEPPCGLEKLAPQDRSKTYYFKLTPVWN